MQRRRLRPTSWDPSYLAIGTGLDKDRIVAIAERLNQALLAELLPDGEIEPEDADLGPSLMNALAIIVTAALCAIDPVDRDQAREFFQLVLRDNIKGFGGNLGVVIGFEGVRLH